MPTGCWYSYSPQEDKRKKAPRNGPPPQLKKDRHKKDR